MLNCLILKVYLPIDASLFDDTELTDVDKLTIGIIENYEIGTAYINLENKTVESIVPRCFISRKIKDKIEYLEKKYCSEIILSDGSYYFSIKKPAETFDLINEYIKKLISEALN
jgi:hypothetical protein